MSNGRSGINQRIADRLLAEGRIQRDDHVRAVEYASRQKGRIEEALIDLEILTETDLLKFIATTHNTRFVSTDKLSKAVIEPRVLQKVPLRTADQHGVFPVLFDDKASALSLVTADPDNDAALQEVKLTAGVKEVRALAARPAAVRAAIAYHYRGDRGAFQGLLRPIGFVELGGTDPFDRRGTGQQAVPNGPPGTMGGDPAYQPAAPSRPQTAQQPPLPPAPPHNTQTWTQAAPVPMGGDPPYPPARPAPAPFPQGPPPGQYGMSPQGPGWQGPPPQGQPWGQQPQQGPPGWQQQPPPGWQQPQQGPGWGQQPGWPPQQTPPWGPGAYPQGAPQPYGMGPYGAPERPPTGSLEVPFAQQGPPPQTPMPRAPVEPAPQPAPSPVPRAPGPAGRARSITPTKIDQFALAPPPAPGSAPSSSVPPAPPKGSAMGLVQGAPVAASSAAPAAAPTASPKSASIPPASPSIPAAASPQLVETLNVLVSLLENSRADLRGHSSMVARLTRKTCERIGLSPLQTAAFTAAAYLHDLGKMGAYHLTSLNVAEYEGHRVAASKSADLPVHLMESVGLLPETKTAIASMYERYDGQGIPNGQGGKDIPLGARILAVADTYADLTQNPRNPYRKILRPFEACEVLVQYRGTIFDPNIVDIFRQSTTGEDMRAKLLSDRHEALIVDPDPEETTVLELRLIEQGFEVKIARTSAQARKILAESEIDAVVSEIDLDAPDAGLALREQVRKDGKGRDITWVVLTGKTDRQTAQRAFDLGVDDFQTKPVSTDIFAAKLRQLIERRASSSGAARGVSGSLTEMSLPDMIQILWHGRKTCALRISGGASSGEIDFSDGQVVDARWDTYVRDGASPHTPSQTLRGEDAFYKMLTLREGDFRLDPAYKPPATRSIQASPEALLLEGMRRLDEGSV